MIDILDKTYVLYVLETLDCTAYKLAQQTGISNDTLSRAKNFKGYLSWGTIAKIQNITGVEFMSPKHLLFSAQFLEHPELNETDIKVYHQK